MNPHLRCSICGYSRRLDVRGLLARATDCPDCPDRPKLLLDRQPNLSANDPQISRAIEASSRLR
jgi:hypothetical protein